MLQVAGKPENQQNQQHETEDAGPVRAVPFCSGMWHVFTPGRSVPAPRDFNPELFAAKKTSPASRAEYAFIGALSRVEKRANAKSCWTKRAAKVITLQHARGTPELVVEITSRGTRTRDETIKRRLYEREGVVEYWVVDPEVDVIRIHRRDGARFARAIELTREANETLTTPLLPGLDIPLRRIFRE